VQIYTCVQINISVNNACHITLQVEAISGYATTQYTNTITQTHGHCVVFSAGNTVMPQACSFKHRKRWRFTIRIKSRAQVTCASAVCTWAEVALNLRTLACSRAYTQSEQWKCLFGEVCDCVAICRNAHTDLCTQALLV
jgi:hypothetical protein